MKRLQIIDLFLMSNSFAPNASRISFRHQDRLIPTFYFISVFHPLSTHQNHNSPFHSFTLRWKYRPGITYKTHLMCLVRYIQRIESPSTMTLPDATNVLNLPSSVDFLIGTHNICPKIERLENQKLVDCLNMWPGN